ncbi:hypothetical protein AA0117_g10178 [Alternaria alternata]|uniref:Uncharacterized protein n=1 Tax=Alternaria alternata TaxID=5599 RepID=A0A4Q4N712_ALTAL|nr:hypothetical protein AALT_g10358 [Alternaria alternata]RYN70841.1 hypothetical protein AA0117_g10178 [Alternaria alternata]
MVNARINAFVCRSCQRKFSASPTLQWFGKSSKSAAKTVEKERKYKSRLLIYDAGDARTTWISFWKAMALLQFGTTLVFGVPPLWNNTNQPDERVRKMQAITVGVLGTIPTLTLAYLTAPFVHQVFLQIPEHARRSRSDLIRFATSLRTNPNQTANTKLEFVTLRIFPFRKHTTAFLHELRALPPKRFRLANIELPKSDAWAQRQREKGIVKRMGEVVREPRFKFYVKEGRLYTMKTGVPGVWEEVAKRIQEQTVEEEKVVKGLGVKRPAVQLGARKLIRPAVKVGDKVKRQTTR